MLQLMHEYKAQSPSEYSHKFVGWAQREVRLQPKSANFDSRIGQHDRQHHKFS